MVNIERFVDEQANKFLDQSNKAKEEALEKAFAKYGYSVQDVTAMIDQNRIVVKFHNLGPDRSDPCTEVFYADGVALFALVWWTTCERDYSRFRFHQSCIPIEEVNDGESL